MLLEKLNYKTFKILLVGVLICLPLGLVFLPCQRPSVGKTLLHKRLQPAFG